VVVINKAKICYSQNKIHAMVVMLGCDGCGA